MDNILPKFQSFTLTSNGINDNKNWKPNDTVINKNYLTQNKNNKEEEYSLNTYESNKLAPNERYQKIIYEDNNPSPLSLSERFYYFFFLYFFIFDSLTHSFSLLLTHLLID